MRRKACSCTDRQYAARRPGSLAGARTVLSLLVTLIVILPAAFGGCALFGRPAGDEAAIEEPSENAPALSPGQISIKVQVAIDAHVNSDEIDDREVVFTVQGTVSQGIVTVEGESSDESLKQALLADLRAIPGVTVVDNIDILPPASLGDMTYGIVKVPVADLGDGPKSAGGSHTVTQARLGDVLRLLKEQDGWFLAQMEDKYLGWIGPESIHRCGESEVDAYRTGRVALIVSKTAPMLDAPGGGPLFSQELVQGSILSIRDKGPEWVRLQVPGGTDGWVEVSHIEEYPSIEEALARRKGGSGYRYGQAILGLPIFGRHYRLRFRLLRADAVRQDERLPDPPRLDVRAGRDSRNAPIASATSFLQTTEKVPPCRHIYRRLSLHSVRRQHRGDHLQF